MDSKRKSKRPVQEQSRNQNRNQNQNQNRNPKSGKKHPVAEISKNKAAVDKNRKGFAFLIFERKSLPDLFVPPFLAQTLFPGDRVEVRLGRRSEILGIKVLEHRFREVVGKFIPNPRKPLENGWVLFEKKRIREEIFVPCISEKIPAGNWVRAKLTFHEKGPFPVTAEVLQTYGPELPPSADISMISAEYNLVEEHSAAAEKQAKELPPEIPSSEGTRKGRVDLKHVPFITIDGETARDFDDAVYVERCKSGFFLWVAIADVSHYVTEGSPIDQDAYSKGTSVYFPERAFHMLPRALSEGLCSLKPNVPRLTLVAKMEFDERGNRKRIEVMEAVIQSKRRATYTEIQSEWKVHQADPQWEYGPHFALYQAIRKARTLRGSIDFDFPEAELRVEPTGEVISIRNRPRLDAHRLIEEFMIAANEGVTDWMMERELPFIYRVHEEPSQEALEKFQALASTVGVKVSLEQSVAPKVMADVVRRLEGHPAQSLLNMSLLRAMKQAVYSSVHGIHYGLASPGYTHFTSPIRRYPDLVVHRLIRKAMNGPTKAPSSAKGPSPRSRVQVKSESRKPEGPAKVEKFEKLEAQLAEICEHCSYRERLATDAERDSIKLKQVRLMTRHLGDEFSGRIVGMVESGLFVQLEDPFVEGMVSGESMADDYYEFNEERMVFFGRHKKKTFKIGDKLKVRLVRADLDRRQIDFAIIL